MGFRALLKKLDANRLEKSIQVICHDNILPIVWPAMPGENDLPEQTRILHHYAKLISNGARGLVHDQEV